MKCLKANYVGNVTLPNIKHLRINQYRARIVSQWVKSLPATPVSSFLQMCLLKQQKMAQTKY